MIISFSFENWMSFRDPVTFSMVASRERRHGEHIPRIKKYKTRVLPLAALYGGNASGKSNFFKAMKFAERLVVKGTSPDENGIPGVAPFRLDANSGTRPSRFEFVLLIDETIYEFRFTLTREAVLEEKLVKISGTSEKKLYHRHDKKIGFDKSLADQDRLKFVFNGTRDNQLFLTNAVSQKVDDFRPVYDWFRDTLQLVTPDSRFVRFDRFLDERSPLHSNMNEILPRLDTGIVGLGSEEFPFENIPLPEELKARIREDVKEGETFKVLEESSSSRFMVSRKEGELIASKLVTYHRKDDGTTVKFQIHEESDGSQRVIELLPAFFDLSRRSSTRVYLIDELDRSLHTLLIRELLEVYLGNCTADTRTQLLLTTHDVMLMDQYLLRRDEMWVAEREADGASCLIPFSDYRDIRYDKDIRKSYLQGRLGGIPRMLSTPSDVGEAFEKDEAQ